MFGISSFELLLILLVGIVVLGPEKLAKVVRTLTKVISEFRRISTDLQRAMNTEIALQEDTEKPSDDFKNRLFSENTENNPEHIPDNSATLKTAKKNKVDPAKKTSSPKKTTTTSAVKDNSATKKTAPKKISVKDNKPTIAATAKATSKTESKKAKG